MSASRSPTRNPRSIKARAWFTATVVLPPGLSMSKPHRERTANLEGWGKGKMLDPPSSVMAVLHIGHTLTFRLFEPE